MQVQLGALIGSFQLARETMTAAAAEDDDIADWLESGNVPKLEELVRN